MSSTALRRACAVATWAAFVVSLSGCSAGSIAGAGALDHLQQLLSSCPDGAALNSLDQFDGSGSAQGRPDVYDAAGPSTKGAN